MAPELRDSILEILDESGPMTPADIRDELDADPSKQLTHYHLKQALDAGAVAKPYPGVYQIVDEAGDDDD